MISAATRSTCWKNEKLGVDTVVSYIAALRFFYVKTLKRPAMKEDLPYPNSEETPAPDDPDTGRSFPADRLSAQPVSLRHAVDDVFGGIATKRVVQAEGEQHR